MQGDKYGSVLYCMTYKLASSGFNGPMFLGDVMTSCSGTGLVFDNSLPSEMSPVTMHTYFDVSNAYFNKETYQAETSQIEGLKNEIFDRCTKISLTDNYLVNCVYDGSEYDFRPVALAGYIGGVLFTQAYSESANAMYYNVPFVYILQNNQTEQLDTIGANAFAKRFIYKVNRLYKELLKKYDNKKNI